MDARARWNERARVAGAVACFAAAGGLAAWVLMGRQAAHARAAAPAAVVQVGDVMVPKGADAALSARRIAQRWEATPITVVVQGAAPYTSTRAGLGARVDLARLAALLGEAGDSLSTMRRAHAYLASGRPVPVAVPFDLDEAPLFERLAELKDTYDRRPEDARANPRTEQVLPHRDGRTLDVHGTIEALYEALRADAREVRAVVQHHPARHRAEELAGLAMGTVLGTYESRYSPLEEARDRTFNLGVAASKLDGLVVMPGEVFDFNAAVGDRSEANGFRPAPVISGGELVDGVGGGTCQVAGTLHAAALFAGLPILERSPHSRPSTYLFMGLDSVVSYPQLNLRFRNDFPFPIVLGFTVADTYARAEIRGARSDRMVTFVRRIDEVIPYEEREVPDSTLPMGARVLRQRGVAGFRVRRFRIVRDVRANRATRTHGDDVYPPTTQIWRVGTAPPQADFVPPEGDTHGEYTADAYLSITQGAGTEGTQITRRAGEMGAPGWTERRGMPQP